MTLTDLFPASHVASLSALARKLDTRRREIKARRSIRRMLDLDDATLDDIGITRGEIDVATSLPLSVDAATELRRMSIARRSQRM